jgi:hypothetical protein
MSEQKSFMQELAEWTSVNIIVPLARLGNGVSVQEFQDTAHAVQKSIRAKVLESYRNGQAAGPKPGREHSYDQAKTR